MKPGSVVVDLAGDGNCELTEPGRTVVKHATLAAPLNLPATMPEHASELYSKNITALLDLLDQRRQAGPDFDDEVIAQSRHPRKDSELLENLAILVPTDSSLQISKVPNTLHTR